MRWRPTAVLAVLAVYFALANPNDVVLSLDPFQPEDPALGLRMPFYLLLLIVLGLGVLIGAIAARRWSNRGRGT